MLCLCPNHHILLDHGGLVINQDLSLSGEEGSLLVHPRHLIDKEHRRYRLERYRVESRTADFRLQD